MEEVPVLLAIFEFRNEAQSEQRWIWVALSRNLDRRHAQAASDHFIVEELMLCHFVFKSQDIKQRQKMFGCRHCQLHRSALLGIVKQPAVVAFSDAAVHELTRFNCPVESVIFAVEVLKINHAQVVNDVSAAHDQDASMT